MEIPFLMLTFWCRCEHVVQCGMRCAKRLVRGPLGKVSVFLLRVLFYTRPITYSYVTWECETHLGIMNPKLTNPKDAIPWNFLFRELTTFPDYVNHFK